MSRCCPAVRRAAGSARRRLHAGPEPARGSAIRRAGRSGTGAGRLHRPDREGHDRAETTSARVTPGRSGAPAAAGIRRPPDARSRRSVEHRSPENWPDRLDETASGSETVATAADDWVPGGRAFPGSGRRNGARRGGIGPGGKRGAPHDAQRARLRRLPSPGPSASAHRTLRNAFQGRPRRLRRPGLVGEVVVLRSSAGSSRPTTVGPHWRAILDTPGLDLYGPGHDVGGPFVWGRLHACRTRPDSGPSRR